MQLAIIEAWNATAHGHTPEQEFTPQGHFLCLHELSLEDFENNEFDSRRIDLVKTYQVGEYFLATSKTFWLRVFQKKIRKRYGLIPP